MPKPFNETCEVVDLLTCSGDYMYPCSCQTYYTCANKDMLIRDCGIARAWNYKTKNCDHEDDVIYNQPCDENKNAWERCNATVSEARLQELKAFCTNTTVPPTSPTTTTTTEAPPGGSDGLNAGVVIGLIVAGAALAIIIITVVVCLLRRKKTNKLKRSDREGTVNNPEYFEGGVADDPYAMIPDNLVKSEGTVNTIPRDQAPLPPTEQNGDAVYDNSAERAGTDTSGYTNTLTRDMPDTPYSHLDGANGYERSVKVDPASGHATMSGGQTNNMVVAGFGVDTLDKRANFSEIPGTNDMGISVEAVSDRNDPDFDTPDYHKLEKSPL